MIPFSFNLTGKAIGHKPTVWNAEESAPERERRSKARRFTSPDEVILSYRNIHRDEPICLIANGPSVNELDLSKINCATIGLNQAWRLGEWTYYCAGDQGQFETWEKERGPIETWTPLFSSHAGPQHSIRIRALHAGVKKFSFDLTEGIYLNNTITAYGIQLAVWMGANPIYIVGLDLNGQHFYGCGRDMPQAHAARQRETFGYFAGLLEGMKYPAQIINLNPWSWCFAFPREKFERVFPLTAA